MLNTDLHSRNIKAEKKMRLEQFIKNLHGKNDWIERGNRTSFSFPTYRSKSFSLWFPPVCQ